MARIVFTMLERFSSHTTAAINLARLLKEHQHEVVFLGKGQDAQKMVEREGISYLQFSMDGYFPKLLRKKLAAATLSDLATDMLRILGNNFDVLICDRFNFIPALAAHKLGKKY